jgi:uncharacterized protein with NAD-binding domain and iron-sulfur cluster
MKIAILGSGVGAMTAAYWLTNPSPDGTRPDHEITVYQLGWRAGGKGASGRNQDAGNRIEEHGLHMWMGFYANAFRMMRAVYGELGRDPGAPLATWRDAFSTQTATTLMDRKGTEWMRNEWILDYPRRPGTPGDQTGFPPPCGYLGTLAHKSARHIDRFLSGHHHDGCPPHEVAPHHRAALRTAHAVLHKVGKHAGGPHEPGQPGAPASSAPHHHFLLRLALKAAQKLIGLGLAITRDCPSAHRVLYFADIAVATALGIIRDLCGTKQWDRIDDVEWRTWLLSNGLHQQTAWCPIVRAMYDLVFAFRDGVATPENADIAAGTATCSWMRIVFDYYDSLFFRMNAGMGDTIFAPIVEVLKKRGVKFKYFHRLREVVPSSDGTTIDALKIGIQATTKNGAEYEPLVDVKGLPSWPSAPLYDQLEQGEELKARGIDLEAYDAPWPDVAPLELRRGRDFDLVVFGLSLGAVPVVCPKILEQKKPWREMVDHVRVVPTQAFQLWLSRNVADLGWPPALNGRGHGERAVLSGFCEPLDTWADMSHLIPREAWDVPVRNIAYFCGPVPDGAKLQDVIAGARSYIDDNISSIWTTSVRKGRFRYDWLCVPKAQGNPGEDDRFLAQYFRVNDQPTEKYVMSVTGSTRYRLDPAHPGYDNLVLAGDWVRNGFAVGCVESAVLGAMKGVQRFCPGMVIVE